MVDYDKSFMLTIILFIIWFLLEVERFAVISCKMAKKNYISCLELYPPNQKQMLW